MIAQPDARLHVLEPLPHLAGVPPVDAAERFRDLPGLALLESALPGRRTRWTWLTADPLVVLENPGPLTDPFGEARSLLRRLDGAHDARDGGPSLDGTGRAESRPGMLPPFSGGLVGFIGYDVGRMLAGMSPTTLDDQGLPGLRLALHDWVIAWDRRGGRAWLAGRAFDGDGHRLDRRLADVRARVAGLRPGAVDGAMATANNPNPVSPAFSLRSSLDRHEYGSRVEAIRDAIAAGEIYQANLTRRLETAFDGDPWPLYRRLRGGEPARYAAFIDVGRHPRLGTPRAILSASPEPFLEVTADGVVRTDPIKGTRPRGRDRLRDRALAAELCASAKDVAENTMIVDVLRNDLGRVCIPGSVSVPRLCRLERTPSVQHLVSTVRGILAPERDPFDLLLAALPGGSITGAPKLRAMEVLERLETVRRGPYTGALGWIGPDRTMATSIVIRTFVADGERLTLHVGGGITWRSDPSEEWQETVAKAAGPLRAIDGREMTDDGRGDRARPADPASRGTDSGAGPATDREPAPRGRAWPGAPDGVASRGHGR